ncbi:3',5'-cyclic-nucleotide phosphodiesterase pde1 [Sporothrix bragantina]|uniref:3',5'-cyclic-nucleotide phosphodiesterase pde1 n=1 Tax=Sporothrix bragantina TaxID=671064 RepID=A0ABP0B7G5_9PEZI
MSGSGGADAPAGAPSSPALQVIVLGSGGGPIESNTTAFLVRSTAEGWRRGSLVALDAGVMMSSITRILEKSLPEGLSAATCSPSAPSDEGGDTPEPPHFSLPYTLTTGPFAGLEVPYASASANASFVQSALVETYLITHPHLDHIAGFIINTAGLPGTRPKRLAGLPSTISAFKTHIFNNVIWPNLSDENNGAGLVTFMRLVEGGSPALGDGDGRGYVEISDGLAVKIWGVSHGHCIERHSHRGSGTSTRFGSMDASSGPLNAGILSPRLGAHHQPPSSSPLVPQQQQHQQHQQHPQYPQTPQQQLPPLQHQTSAPPPPPSQSQQATPMLGPQQRDSLALLSGGGSVAAARRSSLGILLPQAAPDEKICVYDSSAYFIRDVKTGREVLMFGDVEPDSVSLSPRNALIWQEAAPKIAAGNLAAIFVECSYNDAQPLDRLYGHLTPKFVAEEMANLAAEVAHARIVYQQQQAELHEQQKQQQRDRDRERDGRKRKRYGGDDDRMSISNTSRTTSHSRRKTEAGEVTTGVASGSKSTDETATEAQPLEDPVSPRTVKPARVAIASSGEGSAVHVAVPPIVPSEELDVDTSLPSLDDDALTAPSTAPTSLPDVTAQTHPLPLRGLKVVIIHVKEKLRDGPPAGEIILDELRGHEARNPLGCEYIISYAGQSLYF